MKWGHFWKSRSISSGTHHTFYERGEADASPSTHKSDDLLSHGDASHHQATSITAFSSSFSPAVSFTGSNTYFSIG